MFQDDRMIPILSAIMLMVLGGMALQHIDAVARWLTADSAGAPAPAPVLTLHDDEVVATAGVLLPIDVLANDEGISAEARAGLTVISAPACGRLFVRDGVLDYMPEPTCTGRQTIRYSVEGARSGQIATVTARVRPGADPVARAPAAEPAAIPPTDEAAPAVAAAERREAGQPQEAAIGRAPAPAEAPLAEVSAPAAAAPPAPEAGRTNAGRAEGSVAGRPPAPADAVLAAVRPSSAAALSARGDPQTRPAASIAGAAPAGPVLDSPAAAAPAAHAPGPEGRVAALPAPARAAPASAGAPAARSGGDGPAPPAVRLAALLPPGDGDAALSAAAAAAGPAPRSTAPALQAVAAGGPVAPAVAALRPPLPKAVLMAAPVRQGVAGEAGPEPADGAAFLHAVIGQAGDVGAKAAASGMDGVGDAPALPAAPPAGGGPPAGPGGARLAALAPPRLAPPLVPGPALAGLPTERMVLPRPRPTTGIPGPAASAPGAPCLAAPALTLEIRGAGETVIGVAHPCHAGTAAELSYSGLRLAVPLDDRGEGLVTTLGLQPNAPALLTFRDGTTVDFDIPFRGVERVSRVALAWDAPVELGLNALEFGAAPDSPGHVRPGAARSFEEVRRTGGGYLTVWAPSGGVGQSVQVYSWYHRSGEPPGAVKLLVDFVSRGRDGRATACGDGPDAAPQFTVLRSNAGRPERPVIRRLAALDCDDPDGQGGDNRLISGAVDDLVIMSR